MPLLTGMPKWQKWAMFVLLLLTLILCVQILRSGNATRDTLKAQRVETERRDCVTLLGTARRSVFDDVDIYKAILINAGSKRSLLGIQPDLPYLSEVAKRLDASLAEARRLQPPATLDELIAHGGMIDGQHYDACPS